MIFIGTRTSEYFSEIRVDRFSTVISFWLYDSDTIQYVISCLPQVSTVSFDVELFDKTRS